MNSPNPNPVQKSPASTSDETTGLPGLPTWPRVYVAVACSFVLWVVLLRVLTTLFS